MKTALPVPDDVVQRIERLARGLRHSRRAPYRRAAARVLRRARVAIVDALDGLAGASVAIPPP
ncbi:MAG TPA: hypothetical protein VFI16_06035 [Anaeromyxobacteraceae bacterium]|nr:hypothetical protein [Anaeromyxobacteraceae bacterium]